MDKFLINKRKNCEDNGNVIENSDTKKMKSDLVSKQLANKWLAIYKWLEVEWTDEKTPLFKCKFCLQAKKRNILASDKGKPSFSYIYF